MSGNFPIVFSVKFIQTLLYELKKENFKQRTSREEIGKIFKLWLPDKEELKDSPI